MVTIQGRRLEIEECKFVFDRIWDVTVEHNHKGTHGDHFHPDHAKYVMPKELHHVLDLAGQLLNKEAPGDDETAPFKIFLS